MAQAQSLSQIYLDENATTPVLPQASAAALFAMKTLFGNPSSSHNTGVQAKQVVDEARRRAVKIIGAGKGDVIFTSGATEGIQTAILSALNRAKTKIAKTNVDKSSIDKSKKYCILYGATEHKAVPESLKHWNEILEINAEIKAIPVDEPGQLDLDFIEKEVPNALMICTMAVNNETGVYQDLSELDRVIRTNNPDTYWMVDCVQALGKMDLNLADTSIDYAPFSGHKLYAPKGIGFVYIKENAPFTAFIAGGGQEGGLRSGTENLPGLAALNVVFEMLMGESEQAFTSEEKLHLFRQQFVKTLTRVFPQVVFNHGFTNSVPTTLNFAIPGFSSSEIMDLFDAANIRVSSGSACSSKVTSSFVLDAMGLPAWQSESAIRLSFGPAMTQEQVDEACDRIALSAQALVQSCRMSETNNLIDKTELEGLLQFKVGGSCCWMYVDKTTKSTVIIDPLPEIIGRLNTLVACQSLNVVAVIDTHGHADHVSDRVALADKYLVNQCADVLGWPSETLETEIKGQRFQYITLGDKWLIKVATPGHTNDSISLLLCEPVSSLTDDLVVNYAFCGDIILMGSLGRTNFDTSCAKEMYSSLKRLKQLVGLETLICASHDYNNEFTTSIGAEFPHNPLLAQVIKDEIDLEQFVNLKAELDTHLNDESGSEIMCGAIIGDCQKTSLNEYDSHSLGEAISIPNKIKLIDIRESHEYALQHRNNFAQNVPLNRLVQFIQENQADKLEEIVLICRCGSRSVVAAEALSRLGFVNVGYLKGGYALLH
ncbi:MAG: aminotransferase class V-fold PLP-dependent enzyme [Alteromonadaceae bacterium]|nr:aminotransferase class V-fold PLP-dependent enzyme [Alteromonadaceae bacterium]